VNRPLKAERSRFENSTKLLQRARAVIPGGHHLSGRPLLVGEESPLYMARGNGARCWDVDGHEYLDYIGAYGPFLLGYANELVDAAACAQLQQGSLLSLNHPLHVEFAERLVQRFPGADMAVLLKTGSEATTAALRIARRATGRRRVVRCGYHGWHDWCLPLEAFVPQGLDEQVLELNVSDPCSLEQLLSNVGKEVAAVIVAPEMILPTSAATFQQLLATAHKHGAVFILDEVKTALRIKPGSFQQHIGVVPDLTTLSKALGNGWPIAAVVGKREVMECAAGMHLSATYHGETAAMAAAMATLDIVDREPVAEHVWDLGQMLIDGLNESAARHRIPALAFGEPLPPMPFLRFEAAEPARNERLKAAFYRRALALGVLFHPRHLWFVGYAHTQSDIRRTLAIADESFYAASGEI
jgi:glutamate-1-semialdehyde 2,1-aminomutase